MKKIVLIIALMATVMGAAAQEASRTLKPNYKKIARAMQKTGSPYHHDTLMLHYQEGGYGMDIDQWRCLYYGCAEVSLADAERRLQLVGSRFGMQSAQAQTVRQQVNGLTDGIWSTGNGTRRKPLYVQSREEATLAARGYTEPLWFRLRKGKKFCISPAQ